MLTTLAFLAACTMGEFGTPNAGADLDAVLPEAELNTDGDVTADSFELDLSLSEHMETVVHVTWDLALADVVYRYEGVTRRTEGSRTDNGFEAYLVGTPEDTKLSIWLEGSVDEVPFSSETVNIRTGQLSVNVPLQSSASTSTNGVLADGLLLISWFGEDYGGVALVDRSGNPVWVIDNAEAQVSVVSAAWTHEGLWVLQETGDSRTNNRVVRFGLDGQVDQVIDAPDAHHDLSPLPDGGIAWLEADAQNTSRYGKVYGDRIMVATSNENPTIVCSTWDLLDSPNGTSETWNGNWYTDGYDWTHANGLTYSVTRDSFLLSLAGQSMVMEIDAQDGEALWTLEGQTLTPEETGFMMQHSPTWTEDDTLVLFVNRGLSGAGSWAAEFEIGPHRATEVWNSGRDPDVSTHALGRAVRLPDGNTLVNYGLMGLLHEVDDDGDTLWELALKGDWILGQSDLVSLYED